MGKHAWKGWQTSVSNVPQPTSNLYGANLRSSSVESSPVSEGKGSDYVLDLLKQFNLPLTRDNYLVLAYPKGLTTFKRSLMSLDFNKLLCLALLLLMGWANCANAQRTRLVVAEGGMPQWKDAPSYAKENSRNILQRSVFFLPLFGAVYKEKFEALLPQIPKESLRGIVIHNHGCGGMWSLETNVAQFYYQQGFAVITPEFVTRQGNKVGCPGGSEEEMRQRSDERGREGIYQAINPARLASRAHEVMAVVQWLKSRTNVPIIVSGHSEGCRTVYSLHLNDPQIVGGACIKQGLQKPFEHTWRWNTEFPMWQSLEEFDPWVVFPEGTRVQDVSFESRFTQSPKNLTLVIVPGKTHFPLNHEAERASLRQWLNQRVAVAHVPGQNGFNYEPALPSIQEKLKAAP